MKTTSFAVTILALCSVLFFNACTKTNSNNTTDTPATSKPVEVEYSIQPFNHYIDYIVYIDSTGKAAGADISVDFPKGTKKVMINGKPFVWLFTETHNSTSYEVDYTLSISVNGQLKVSKNCFAPANTPQAVDSVGYQLGN
jgi:hypothetical protein